MTNSQESKKSDKPQSMIEADAANGEAADTDRHGATTRPDPHGRPVAHATGTRQAEENQENDPPA